MTQQEWSTLCQEYSLEIGEHENGKLIVTTKEGRMWHITPEAIQEMTLTEATELISGDREVAMLKTYSRIVGYISATDSWNQSKLGELADRKKGNYRI